MLLEPRVAGQGRQAHGGLRERVALPDRVGGVAAVVVRADLAEQVEHRVERPRVAAQREPVDRLDARVVVAVVEPRRQRVAQRLGVLRRQRAEREGGPVADARLGIARELDQRVEHALVVAARQRVGRALADARVRVAAQPQQRLDPVRRAEVAERARDRRQHLRVLLARLELLERGGALGRERPLRHAELAEHVGGDGAGARVVAARQLLRGRERRLVAAAGERGHVRRPLGVRAPLADRQLRRARRASAPAAAGRARS